MGVVQFKTYLFFMVHKGSMFKTVIMKQIMDSSGAELGFKKKDEPFIIRAAERPPEL